jgi:putative ABC transport system permease protein
MRPAWRLAISSAWSRRNRTALLAATVALSAALIAAVLASMSSLHRALGENLLATVGRADLRLKPTGGGQTVPRSLLELVRTWPEVQTSAGRLEVSMGLQHQRLEWTRPEDAAVSTYARSTKTYAASAVGLGIIPEEESLVRTITLVDGRLPNAPGEIALDELLAGRLSTKPAEGLVFTQLSRLSRGAASRAVSVDRPAEPPPFIETPDVAESHNRAHDLRVGDRVRWVRLLRAPIDFTVVGILAQPPLGGRSQAYVHRDALAAITGDSERLSQIDILLRPGHDPQRVADTRRTLMPEATLLQTAEKITSGLQQNLHGNRFAVIISSTMAFLAAAYIIMTGLTTAVTERRRELAVLRCIGATRANLAESQIVLGGLIGIIGALIGVPLGVSLAAALVARFPDEIPTGLHVTPGAVAAAVGGAIASGILGALVPALMAARVTPLQGLAVRADPPRRRTIAFVVAFGLLLVGIHPFTVFLPDTADGAFWPYVSLGIPSLLTGYFLLGVGVVLVLAATLAPLLTRVLRLPPDMLARTVRATPYRFGFTAGAMYFGLAIMVGIWSQGGAILRDWISTLRFPEAFVLGLNLSVDAQRRLDAMPFVDKTCAITLHPIETEFFGIRGLATYTSTFIAFEPDPFFDMTNLTWVQGDPQTAGRRLNQGGAVIVAREFTAARGLGVGDTFTCKSGDRSASFEIVGVVHSPGLDLVSQYFSIGQDYTDQSIHAVFGSRRDLREKFGSDAIQLIQVGLVPEGLPGAVDDKTAVDTIRRELFDAGIMEVGSARRLLADVRRFAERSLLISSAVGVFAMIVASLGVANVIAAGIAARTFEFGVLRAVGGTRHLLARLILAESLLIAAAACILGTLAGLQGSIAGQRFQKLVVGIETSFAPPWRAIAIGCVFVIVVCVAASIPSVISLLRRRPRELLAAMRG